MEFLSYRRSFFSKLKSISAREGGIKKFLPLMLLVVLVIGVMGIVVRNLKIAAAPADNRIPIKGARAHVDINKDFEFPVSDAKGKELTKIKFTIENAELRDEIIVNGRKATAVTGRTFLIISLKLTNPYEKGLDVPVKNYLRLTMNGNDKDLFAPDILAGETVSVQAIASKSARVGFPINDSDKNIVLLVGEINGKKESVPLNFP